MCTKNQLNDVMCQIAKAYREFYGDKLVTVYLYGSYARGDNSENSDIDMVGIVNGNRVELQQILYKMLPVSCRVGVENDVVIAPTVIPYDEFVSMRDILPYYQNIYSEGVEISA
ncbi:MAG: nucleotidyltransferase domain-containing protein [Lachnospiraceae bacterium]